MRLDYYVPSPELRSLLTAHAVADDVRVLAAETLPAMLPNLHIRLGGGSGYAFEGGTLALAPRVALIGPTTAAYTMVLEPGLDIVTTGLLPQGWLALMGAPAEAFSDCVIDGTDIWGASATDRLCDGLLSAAGDQARLIVLESFLKRAMGRFSETRLTQSSIVDHWLEHSPDLSLDALCGDLALCGRQVRRVTLDLYGASPKTLAMKYRCLRAASLIAVQGEDGLVHALQPFADQSHLIRDFRRFVGWTPVAFLRDRQSIAYATLVGRRRAGAVRPLSLLS